jgi:hypothetical protein
MAQVTKELRSLLKFLAAATEIIRAPVRGT